ncbi:MAG: phenylalanine--tRNA ligase subunit beta [archaeon]
MRNKLKKGVAKPKHHLHKMPTIEISKKDLCSITGKNLSSSQLEEVLQYAKATVESVQGDVLKIEAGDANRPDLWSAEGISREIKGHLGIETGMPRYKAEQSEFILKNNGVRARPVIACAVVKNLKLNDEAIKQIVQLQEKLCENFGLKRKEAALGVYDFDRIKWPISYSELGNDEIKFVPLGMNEALSPKEILQRHEKGIQYRHLLESGKYPIIIDSAKQVLSMPPVINSDYTGKVSEKTKNVFIEVTGNSFRFILPILNIMAAALAERGGKIYSVKVTGKNPITTPNLEPVRARLDVQYCNRILGTAFNEKEICKLLEKARFSAKQSGKFIEVLYLPYRQDIMDERDLIEDVAIAYGYQNLKPDEAKISTIGKAQGLSYAKNRITEMLIGLNMQEAATFSLSSKDTLFRKMNLPETEVVEVSNPVSVTYSCLRNSVMPGILDFLSQNIKKEMPQKIFEIGECYSATEQKTMNKLCIAITHKDANFTEIKQILDYIAKTMNIECSINEASNSSFLEGRTGIIRAGKNVIGILGEVSPKVLSEFGIEMPVALLEIDLDVFN